jgi:hypothetical protein
MPFLPLTLTLSPKGRGKITFDKTTDITGRVIEGMGKIQPTGIIRKSAGG